MGACLTELGCLSVVRLTDLGCACVRADGAICPYHVSTRARMYTRVSDMSERVCRASSTVSVTALEELTADYFVMEGLYHDWRHAAKVPTALSHTHPFVLRHRAHACGVDHACVT
eukprot:1913482-Rhodomonas_salina.1